MAPKVRGELRVREQWKARLRTRVVVKFRDHVQLPYDRTAASWIVRLGIGPWQRLEADFKGITLGPLFATRKPDEIAALVSRGKRMDPTYKPPNLLTYFAIDVPSDHDPQAVAKTLSDWPSVAIAYVEPPPVGPPVVNAADDPRSPNQGYLDPAPDGVDAEYAWGFTGGDGAGQSLVDMEYGWTFNHEDLVAHAITMISGVNWLEAPHGTAVLGEVAASDNTVGCVGITPALASIRCVSQFLEDGGYSESQPILDAIAAMSFGDVLLLEAQTDMWGYHNVPVEIEPAVFDAIRLATALGIMVVEAAGNGAVDLDTVVNTSGQQIFNRAGTDFQDSGAIIVGAASSAAPHTRMNFSCFGSRVDCYAWGENVDTLWSDYTVDPPTNLYTTGFAGTSSASPIVTGAALAVQGLAEANLGHRLDPWQLRAILSDPANGTASQDPAVDRIGVMPNLRAIIDGNILNLAPDVYLRDFVGDTGDPHTEPISASPDVILQETAVADPQASFGEGSGTENSAMLGSEAAAGQDNLIYVRVRNRGGSVATDIQATVYWAPPASLVTPDLWTLVGSTPIVNVPTGNLLTVSDGIVWPSEAIPATGHYCLVALIGNAQDPAPAPADFLNCVNFQLFIRENNNVTWRNFNVVEIEPPAAADPPNFVALPFMAVGPPDRARRMRLEVVGRLPKGAVAFLEMPPEFAELMRARLVDVKGVKDTKSARNAKGQKGTKGAKGAKGRRAVHVPVNPWGRTALAEAGFPAKVKIPLRLLVQVPKNLRHHEFEIFARQMFENQEVGRVTWRLVPRKKLRRR